MTAGGVKSGKSKVESPAGAPRLTFHFPFFHFSLCALMLIGVDVGGTKIAVAAATPEGRIVASRRFPTSARAVDDIVGAVKELQAVLRLADARSPLRPEGFGGRAGQVGVSVPGLLSPDGETVRWAPNVPGWIDLPLRRRLEDALGAPVVLGWDGHAALLAEAWLGAARGFRNVALLAIGTGVGGAAIVDGRLLRGRDGIAGAAGWMTDADAKADHARDGELESLVSGPAIEGRGGWENAEMMADVHRRIGMACASLVSLLNPERVILAGGTGVRLDPAKILAVVRERAQPQAREGVDVVTAQCGEEAGVLGAMCFVSQKLKVES